jgi:molybdopterin converting factor small subunit
MAASVTLELFGIARRRAGVAEVDVDAATLGEALSRLEERFPALGGEVVRGGRLLSHWRATAGDGFVDDPATPLAAGARVAILSGLAGG